MKKNLILLLFATASLAAWAQTEVMSKIDKVTVYPNSAMVEKSITTHLQKGENKLLIRNNAQNVGTNDIHFASSPDWFICSMYSEASNQLETEVLARQMPQAAYNQYLALKSQSEDIALKISNANILLATLNQQALALNNLKAVSNTKVFDTIASLKAQFDYQRKESQAINSSKIKTLKEIEDLNGKQRQLNTDLENLVRKYTGGRKVQRNQNDVYVTIYTNKNIPNAKISYNYRTQNVSCGYSYDVMLDEEHKSAVFSLKASVWQNTGENWNDCQLIFSTTESGYAGFDAELPTYLLDFYTPAPAIQHTMAKVAKSRVLERNMVTSAELEESVDASAMNIAQNDISIRSNQTLSREYELVAKQSIASGDRYQTLLLQNDSTPVLFARYATPKNEEKVHFTALLPEWENLGLLEVGCKVYMNNRFVSTSDVVTAGSGDTLRFAVGNDPNVLVKRKLTLSSPEKSGLISKEIVETVAITLNIKNTKNETVALNLKDQVPVSANSEIKISDIKTDGGVIDSRTGVVRWRLSLKPLEQQSLTLTYTVRYPKEREGQINLRR